MGVESLEKYATGWTSEPGLEAPPEPNSVDIHIEDVMSRLYRAYSRSGFRGLMASIAEPLRLRMRNGCRLIILAFDNGRFPTPTKEHTKAQRAARPVAADKKFPRGTQLFLDELKLVDVDGREITEIPGFKIQQTPSLRAHIGQAFIRYLQTLPLNEKQRWPQETVLIVDYEPELFVWNPFGALLPFDLKADELKGDAVAEAEVKAVSWVKKLVDELKCPARTYGIESVDSDVLALLVYHAWDMVRTDNAPILWWISWKRGGTNEPGYFNYWNINWFIRTVLPKQGLHRSLRRIWLMWCILLGTDHFVLRSEILYKFPNDALLRTMVENQPFDGFDTLQRFDEMLRSFYQELFHARDILTPRWKDLRTAFRSSNMYREPLPNGIRKAHEAALAAFRYWDTLRSDSAPVRRLEAPPAPEPMDASNDEVQGMDLEEEDRKFAAAAAPQPPPAPPKPLAKGEIADDDPDLWERDAVRKPPAVLAAEIRKMKPGQLYLTRR